jgi:hypothetical protein
MVDHHGAAGLLLDLGAHQPVQVVGRLVAYDVADAPWFAGRERLVAELVARLAPVRLLALVGASGSGKSSLVRAGLLASLEAGALPGSEGWVRLVMRPGPHPMRELARVAPRGAEPTRDRVGQLLEHVAHSDSAPGRVVLVVDQFEETWTACADEAERAAFLHAIAEIAEYETHFSPDGSMLATTGDDGTARIWNPITGKQLRRFAGPTGPVWGPSFTARGSRVAASWDDEGLVRVFDLGTGQTVREIEPGGIPGATSLGPDGQRLAIGLSGTATVVVVDLGTGREVFTLRGHSWPVNDVGWSPNGRWIATSSVDDTVKIWEARTGRLQFTPNWYQRNRHRVHARQSTPGGRRRKRLGDCLGRRER